MLMVWVHFKKYSSRPIMQNKLQEIIWSASGFPSIPSPFLMNNFCSIFGQKLQGVPKKMPFKLALYYGLKGHFFWDTLYILSFSLVYSFAIQSVMLLYLILHFLSLVSLILLPTSIHEILLPRMLVLPTLQNR